jgi:hypothetical protein
MRLFSQHVVFDTRRQRAYLPLGGGFLAVDLAELRRELAALGLDWPEGSPEAFRGSSEVTEKILHAVR